MHPGKLIIVLFGPPGAGKGTQAKLISDKYNTAHISTGDILRNAIEKKTELGKKANLFMHKGELVPDDIVCGLIAQRIAEPDCKRGVLFDGFPRNLQQAEMLQNLEYVKNTAIFFAILVNLSDEEVVRRLSNRRYCPNCKSIFNLIHKIPKKEKNGVYFCDECGADLIHRDDDIVETIKNRLKIYHNSTEQMIDFYKRFSVLHIVDGNVHQDAVFSEIRKVIER